MLFFFKQKTAYEMRMSDWSSDVCSSDLAEADVLDRLPAHARAIGEDISDGIDVVVRQARRQVQVQLLDKGPAGKDRDVDLREPLDRGDAAVCVRHGERGGAATPGQLVVAQPKCVLAVFDAERRADRAGGKVEQRAGQDTLERQTGRAE